MKKLLLKIDINHNERWPRAGVMFVPTFLLFERNELIFEWQPVEASRKLKIEIEATDYKGDSSRNRKKIYANYIESNINFKIEKKGLYNIVIENPHWKEGTIGVLEIYNLSNDENTTESNRPELFYKYELRHNGQRLEKVCIDSGYQEDKGEIELTNFRASDETHLIEFYDSKRDGFIITQKTTDRIVKSIMFEAAENEEIGIKAYIDQELLKNGIGTSIHLGKLNSHPFSHQILNEVKFISNRDAKFIITAKTYKENNRFEGDIPNDLINIRLFSNINTKPKLNECYKLVEVYNTVFNRTELEPIKIE